MSTREPRVKLMMVRVRVPNMDGRSDIDNGDDYD